MASGPTTVDLNGNTLSHGYFSGVGEDLTGLNASHLTSGTAPAEVLPLATALAPGIVQPDGTTITVVGGVISAAASGGTPIRSITVQKFTSAGTYVPNAHLVYAIVEVQGGGGAGGGCSTSNFTGAGGGGGGYAKSLLSATAIGTSQSVTVGAGGVGVSGASGGAGGTSLFGTLLSASGGGGGISSMLWANISPGGVATGGNIVNIPGQSSLVAPAINVQGYYAGGSGGSAVLGFGGAGVCNAGVTSVPGSGVGAGAGGGGVGTYSVGRTSAGANGAQGMVLITEFNSQ